MCGTIDPGSCIRCILGFDVKTRYDNVQRLGCSKSKALAARLDELEKDSLGCLPN
jgi:hypothetical protein